MLVESEPSKVRILPESLINKIAAGEVVERPASVVKELVENALDAGATKLAITLKSGGIDEITVCDNGQGMDADDMQLAIRRHATSKLPDDTLIDIRSFGFRGCLAEPKLFSNRPKNVRPHRGRWLPARPLL